MDKFSRLAAQQQTRLRNRFSRNESLDEEDGISHVNPVSITLFALFVIVVFGGLTALYLYCLYVGIEVFLINTEEDGSCEAPDLDKKNILIGGWLIAHGVLGLLSTSILIVATIPDRKDITDEVIQRKRRKMITIPLGLSELFHFIWIIVGTAWVSQLKNIENQNCKTSFASKFTFAYLISLWCAIGAVCFLVCCCIGLNHGANYRPSSMSDDIETWKHTISLSEIGSGRTALSNKNELQAV